MHKRIVLRLSLLLCPRAFRDHYREQLTAEFEAGDWRAAAWDIAVTGALMRIEAIGRDVQTAGRSLFRAPLVTAVAVIAMGLAIAANVVVASLVEGFMLRPLPFSQPGQLLFAQETDLGRAMSYPDAQSLARAIGLYADLALAAPERVVFSTQGRPLLVDGATVSPNYFGLLGIRPVLGHFFSKATADTSQVVISYEFWRAHYAGGPGALGQLLRLGLHSYQIVGVAPPAFHDPTPYGFVDRSYWHSINPHDPRSIVNSNYNYNAIVRVRAGLSGRSLTGQIQASLATIVKRRVSVKERVCCVRVTPIADDLSGPIEPLLLLLYVFVSIVIAIAFVNVAALNIARNTTRAGDLTVRVALGASPARIASQLTIEAFLQALLGCAVGLVLACPLLRELSSLSLLAAYPAQTAALGMSPWLAVYAFVLVLAATVSTGLLPGLGRSGRRIGESLQSVGRGGNGFQVRKTLARLVVVEIALATVLVAASTLIFHSAVAMTQVPLGFDPSNLYVATVRLPHDGSVTKTQMRTYVQRVIATLQSSLGMDNVAASVEVPLSCCSTVRATMRPGAAPVTTLYNAVTPQYFNTLRIPILLGRTFRASDDAGAPCVAIVDETLAHEYYGTVDAVGRILTPDVFSTQRGCTVVGVVKSVPQAYGEAQAPMLYLPMAQAWGFLQFVFRMPEGTRNASAEILRATLQAGPSLPEPRVISYDTLMEQQLAVPQISAAVFGILAFIALVLALSGIYALTAYSVARRTREFGIRSAVGASPVTIVRHVCGDAVARGGIGVLIGVVLASLFSIPLKTMLYGTSEDVPMLFLGVVFAMLTLTVFAALAPALRASHIEPAVALRHE